MATYRLGAPRDVPLEALDELARALRRAVAGKTLPDFGGSPYTPIAGPTLGHLRRRILSLAHAAGDQEAYAESHGLLVAIEQLQEYLAHDDLGRVANQLRGETALDLLVEVAHDMRSPLGAIQFLVDRVRSGASGPLSRAQIRQLGLAYSAAFELGTMTSDIMELARGSGRLLEPEPVPFSLGDVLRQVEAMVRPLAEEKGLTLILDAPARGLRLGHPAALRRVLLNLATNACKFTAQGEVRVGAYASGDAAGDDNAVHFVVQDTGRGIAPDVADQLFSGFQRRSGGGAAGGTLAFSSAGLGLAICRKLVTAMSGQLKLDPSPSEGSCFRFSLLLPPA